MDHAFTVGLRLALYIDLMLLAGLPLFLLQAPGQLRAHWNLRQLNRLLMPCVLLGVLLSLVALARLALELDGENQLGQLRAATLHMLWTQTAVGQSWILRMAMLLGVLLALALTTRAVHGGLWLLAGCSATALATLAWNGHGAMSEGPRHYLHLASDILHLWAASAWFGALLAFVLLLRGGCLTTEDQPHLLASALKGFERTGGLIVLALLLSGVANHLMTSGPVVATLTESLYGRLLLLKLLLLAAMLGFAALNRFHLTPLLERSIQTGDPAPVLVALRRSLRMEASIALAIFALVAWLGTLNPEGN
ncbi:MAG: copper homeostasis membrane protein CopD [Pseudomonas sp.]|uniref:copper homeostasis membrane protein CopD n=1 Tax=unclassified Pseudomonas TaxID=196821 RepID=UPI001CFB3BD5|nr:copper homeostasis membrane protein CopD [Pseudomonas sp. L5B5]UCZ85229.1 copper homeostasis membrane protein CopD [Pseudomonas sp. L5B5]